MHHGLVNWRAKGIRAPCPQLTFSRELPQICRVGWDKLNLDSISFRMSIAMMSPSFWCFNILKAKMFDYKAHWESQPRAESAKRMFGDCWQGCKYGEGGSGLNRFRKGVWRCNIPISNKSESRLKGFELIRIWDPELISWVPTWLGLSISQHLPNDTIWMCPSYSSWLQEMESTAKNKVGRKPQKPQGVSWELVDSSTCVKATPLRS